MSSNIRRALPAEFAEIGQLMVQVYSALDGFPKPDVLPHYYYMLANVGELTTKPDTELLVSLTHANKIAGAVVLFYDMQHYGSGGMATKEVNAGGFRLLAVNPSSQGNGVGKSLVLECIERCKQRKLRQVIIHTTLSMQKAWKMYEALGFERSEDLDFAQGDLLVFGFRLQL